MVGPQHVALAISSIAFAVAAQAACPLVKPGPDAELATRLDERIEAAVADGFAGQVAILKGGALIYSRAVGDADADGRTPVTGATLFDVASISKYFTAALAIKAEQAGRIALEEPVAGLVPGTRLAARGTTWLDLLTHRAGLRSTYVAEEFADPAQALAAIDSQPLNEDGAGGFHYTNDGFDLVAILLERVFGRPFEQAMHEEVLTPACLTATRLWSEVDPTDPALVAQPLEPFPARLLKRNYGMLGSIGVLTTAEELVRFEYALSRGAVLGSPAYERLTEPRAAMSLGHAALGAFLLQNERLGRVLSARGAEDWGTNAMLNHYLDRDLIVAVVTSRGPAEGAGELFRTRLMRDIEALL